MKIVAKKMLQKIKKRIKQTNFLTSFSSFILKKRKKINSSKPFKIIIINTFEKSLLSGIPSKLSFFLMDEWNLFLIISAVRLG